MKGHSDEAEDKKLFSKMLKKALPAKKNDKAVVKAMPMKKVSKGK